MQFAADYDFKEPLTRAKFVGESKIVVASTMGSLYQLEIKVDNQGCKYLDRPKLLYTAEGQCAIWDLAVWQNRQDDVESQSAAHTIFVATDAGKVLQLNLGASIQETKAEIVHDFRTQSALCLSVDSVHHQHMSD